MVKFSPKSSFSIGHKDLHRMTALAGILALSSHIFCCGLPLVFAIASLLTSVGVFSLEGLIPSWYHEFEIAMMVFSGAMLLLTAVIHLISWRMDCIKDAGCSHSDCTPKKKRSNLLLYIATIAFLVNIFVFTFGKHNHEVVQKHDSHSLDEHGHDEHAH